MKGLPHVVGVFLSYLIVTWSFLFVSVAVPSDERLPAPMSVFYVWLELKLVNETGELLVPHNCLQKRPYGRIT